jgi:hypothetical protein
MNYPTKIEIRHSLKLAQSVKTSAVIFKIKTKFSQLTECRDFDECLGGSIKSLGTGLELPRKGR